jgi:hypothetical protein
MNVRLLFVVAAIGLTIGLISWNRQQSPGKYEQSINDTTPKKMKDREKKVRDLDDVLDELNEADMNVDMNKIRKELNESLKEINAEKIKAEVEKALKEVYLEKIKSEVETSLAKVDFDKIKKQMQEAMKQLDEGKIQKEIQESMTKMDWDKIKTEIEKVKEVDMKNLESEMKKVQDEMKELGPKLEKEMAKAKESLEKAKAEIKEFKTFVDGLEKDGLINKKEGYNLKHKDGELLINGKKASEQTYNKYRSFLETHKKFTIQKSDDDFDMKLD